jgi:signal transduction histidine kinase
MNPYPQYSPYPPRVRVEWLIAGVRVALAAGALLAIAVDPPSSVLHEVIAYLFSGYLAYSLAVLALVWAPVRFFRGWDLAVFAVDFAIFSLLFIVGEGAASPFFVYFMFLTICATVRWQARGTVLILAVTMVVYPAVSLFAIKVLGSAISPRTVVIRTVYMLVIAALLGYLEELHHRFQREISRLASWPRRIARTPRDVVSEVITQSADLLEAPRIVLIWEEPGTGRVNLAWRAGEDVMWADEPEGRYGSFVLPALERRIFQTSNATAEFGRVVVLTESGFRDRWCRPLNEALRTRFNVHAVQSWPLEGELIQGRLFALDKTRMGIDDLVAGELVARLAVSRLDSQFILERLREAAALDERVRVARDLHDSLLQSQTGAALQLLAARRLLERDPKAGKERFEEVQQQLERGELEMRSFIRDLRPERSAAANPSDERLSHRLENLRRRIGRQWNVKIVMQLHAADTLPSALAEDVYRLAHEAVVNAARHADASVIEIDLTVTDEGLRIAIVDDGRGFPFQGTYDLAALGAMNQGPLTLKERVAELHGALTLSSHDTGTELLITLPLAQVTH